MRIIDSEIKRKNDTQKAIVYAIATFAWLALSVYFVCDNFDYLDKLFF